MLFRGTIDLLEPDTDDVTVYADKKPIPQSEFFAAGQNGIRPAMMFLVRTQEYNDQKKIRCEERTYSVYRVYERPDGMTELYCEVRLGGN
jgi:SPP1 family predicted phage head-tail adaptor